MKVLRTVTIAMALFIIGTLFLAGFSYAEIPRIINYQGKLTDPSGKPVSDGTYSVTFRIYDQAAGGSPLWYETQSLTTQKGVFSTQIGATKDLNLPFDKPYYLGIQVGSDAEMIPRQPLTSTGYAFRAETAETAQVIMGVDKSGLMINTNTINPNSQVNIKASSLNIQGVIKTAIDLNVDITTKGVNGLDIGTEAASTWYYVWVIYNPTTDTVAGLLSKSATSPTMPDGYTRKRLVGAVRNNASSNFVKFYQYNDEVLYDEYINVLNVGNANWTDLNLSNYIPSISQIARLQVRQWGGGHPGSESMGIQFRPNGSSSANGQVHIRLYQGYQTTITIVSTDSSQMLEYKAHDSRVGGGISLNRVDVIGFVLTGI